MPNLPGWDPAKPKRQIYFFDAVNLYGKAMCEPLPIGAIRFLEEHELTFFNAESIGAIPDDNELGYALKFDLRLVF